MPIRLVIVLLLCTVLPAHATWKPQYGKSPQAVQLWFKLASPPAAARARLGIATCCEQAERLRTRFVASPSGEWSYYPDPNCAHRGCPILPIPNDVVHTEPIRALDPADDMLPQFEAMRREGVLFIWRNAPSCFWPPSPGI